MINPAPPPPLPQCADCRYKLDRANVYYCVATCALSDNCSRYAKQTLRELMDNAIRKTTEGQ